MAITEVGSGSQRVSGGSNDNVFDDFAAVTFPANVTSGNFLICAGAVWGVVAAPTSVAVSDTRGTSYTVVLGTVGAGMTWRTFIAYGVAPSSGANAVTINPVGTDAAHSGSFSIDEFAGEDTTPASVNGGTSTGLAGTSPIGDAITTATDNELIISAASHDGPTSTWTVSGTGTLIGKNEANSANQCHAVSFRIVTTATSYTMSWVVGGGGATAACIQTYSFKELVGGGGGGEGFVLVAN